MARLVLTAGALFQIFLISGLPLMQMNSSDMQNFISLATLFVVSAGCAISLRRWGRESIATLTVGSIFAMYLVVRLAMAIQHQLSSDPAPFSPAQKLSVVLALGTLATLPIALLVAWPLRRVVPGSEPQTAISRHS